MRRVMVIGSCGTGKSTLARNVGARLGLPVIHLDSEYWRPGWVDPTPHEWRAQVAALATRDAWVMDGNYSGTWDLRLLRAHAVIWLDLPRAVYFARMLKRSIVNYGRVRADLAPGCPERLDWDFVKWVWTYPRRTRPKTIAALDRVRGEKRVVVLRSRADVRAFEAGLPGTLQAKAVD